MTDITDLGHDGTAVLDNASADRPDIAAVIDLALTQKPPVEIEDGTRSVIVTPPGATAAVIDTRFADRRYDAQPDRVTGSRTLDTADSFIAYVSRHRTPGTTLWGSDKTLAVVGVLNDHENSSDRDPQDVNETAGWGDHQATLKLRYSPEWERWLALDRKMVGQEQFANHIEDSLAEIRDPDAATMLELAQTFEATTTSKFQSAQRLASGSRSLVYTEDGQARAGSGGNLEIPESFTLALLPFIGSPDTYSVTARLRYRIVDQKLQLGYILDRLEETRLAAFDDVLSVIAGETGLIPLRGTYGG